MNDGGGESGRDNENDSTETKLGGDDFGRSIAKIAVTQICESVGFQSFHQSALESLSDVAIRYLRDLGKTAHFYANLSGRAECNFFDIVQGLEDLESCRGFSGASEAQHCLASSGVVQEITRYVNSAEEIPFARSIPCFPVVRNHKLAPSFAQIGETPAGKHIPDWLPAFPDPHTYIRTPVWNERPSDPRTDKIEQARQRRKAEMSLLSLQQRLACNGTTGPSLTDTGADGGKGTNQTVESNSFLAPPLQFGEKDVSPVPLPTRLLSETITENRVSILETFSPAIEAAKNGVCDSGDGERKILPIKRPTMSFKFGIDKKFIAEPLVFNNQNGGVGKKASWFVRDDEKDDKKRRVEQILKEAMENPQELTQL